MSLGDGDGTSLWKHLASAVDCGAAVMVSRTQDGGAISVTLYLGSHRYKEYATSPEQLEVVFQALSKAASDANGG
jgi:hypothetical protein